MLTGIALAVADVPVLMIDQHHLETRLVERGEREVRFLFADVGGENP
jgi:hypothetical protein